MLKLFIFEDKDLLIYTLKIMPTDDLVTYAACGGGELIAFCIVLKEYEKVFSISYHFSTHYSYDWYTAIEVTMKGMKMGQYEILI